ncbi:MAG: hypothetical protein ACE5HI_06400 [bacterium]
MRGNKVTLEKLDKNEAVVRMTLIYFELYQQAGHLNNRFHLKITVNFLKRSGLTEQAKQDGCYKSGTKPKNAFSNSKSAVEKSQLQKCENSLNHRRTGFYPKMENETTVFILRKLLRAT